MLSELLERIASFIILIALAIWLGSMIFFSFGVAPTAFQTLPDTRLAGDMVGAVMNRLYGFSCFSGCAILLAIACRLFLLPESRKSDLIKAALVLGMLTIASYSQSVVTERVSMLRQDRAFLSDPVKKAEFDSQHRLSVVLMSTNILIALFLLGWETRRKKGTLHDTTIAA